MVMDKKSKLGKLKMPMPKKPDEMDMGDEGMDYSTEESKDKSDSEDPDMDSDSSDQSDPMGDESPKEEASELAKIPDDELMAEIQKRGLMKKMDKSKEEEQGDQDLDLGM